MGLVLDERVDAPWLQLATSFFSIHYAHPEKRSQAANLVQGEKQIIKMALSKSARFYCCFIGFLSARHWPFISKTDR